MKKLFKLFSLLVLLPLASVAGEEYTEITAEQLVEMKAAGDVVIVDSRGEKYLDGQAIEGANLLTADNLTEESLSAIASKEAKIVFYCTNVDCPASAKSAAKAASLGFTNLYKYTGGIEDWVSKGLPVQKI